MFALDCHLGFIILAVFLLKVHVAFHIIVLDNRTTRFCLFLDYAQETG